MILIIVFIYNFHLQKMSGWDDLPDGDASDDSCLNLTPKKTPSMRMKWLNLQLSPS